MSIKHVVEGMKHFTGARNWTELHFMTGLPFAVISRCLNGKQADITMRSLSDLQERTDVPLQQVMAWYRLPDHLRLSGNALAELIA